jgi:signal peptidase I
MVAMVMLILLGTELVVDERNRRGYTRPRPQLHWMAEFLIIVAVVLAVDFVVESLVVKRYRTSSGSMNPTIQVGQQLLVDRLGPQFRHPHRGDLIIFNPPAGAAINACGVDHPDDQPCPLPTSGRLATVFVKRVVAVPGDEISVNGGIAYVNGRRQRSPFLPGPVSCDICDLGRAVTVPPGYYFVMGDNRDHSNDSRVWGPVPNDWIIGRVFLSYWPITRWRIF